MSASACRLVGVTCCFYMHECCLHLCPCARVKHFKQVREHSSALCSIRLPCYDSCSAMRTQLTHAIALREDMSMTWLQDLRARESQPCIRQDACQHVQTGIPSQDTASLDRLFSSEDTTCSELTEAAACLCAVHLEASTCSRQKRIYRTYSNSSASPCGCASQKASKQQACRYAIAGSAKEVVLLKTRTAQSMTNRQGKLEMRAKVPQRLHTIRVTLYIRWS